MARSIEVVQYDSFTTRPFSGNPAAVVCEAEDLSEPEMQAIAREMNLSETAFVLPSDEAGADFRFRWFTPESEVPFCGHATLAAAFALEACGRWRPAGDDASATVTCRIGRLRLTGEGQDRLERVWIDVPRAELADFDAAEPFYDICGIPPSQRAVSGWRPQWSPARAKIVLPVTSAAALGAAAPDFRRLAALEKEHGCLTVLVTPEVREAGSAVQLRVFAPSFGVDEDPVTGAANAVLASYLLGLGWLSGAAGDRVRREDGAAGVVRHYVAEQGDFLGRPGRVDVEVAGEPGSERVRIGGPAVRVLEGRLTLDSGTADR